METLTLTPPDINAQASPQEQRRTNREAVLQALLPYDFDYASSEQSGLIDMFYYDPETGEDGLMHTLAGNVVVGEDGAETVEGFHHEPSGAFDMPKTEVDGNIYIPEKPRGVVDRKHLAGANKQIRRKYAEYPYETYHAHVAINGLEKVGTIRNTTTGQQTVRRVENGMYPKEYDALAVMQTVKLALNGRDASLDELNTDNEGRPVKIAYGEAPMLDGVHFMKLRMVLDSSTGRVITAIPMAKKGNKMKLTSQEIRNHLGIE